MDFKLSNALPGLAALALLGCSEDPHVIGRYRPADAGGAEECVGRHAEALVCSGFEAEALSDWPDATITPEGAVERSTARAHSGVASLRAESRAVQTTAVVAREFGPIFSGELHLRAYVYVASELPTQTLNLFFLGHEPNPAPPEPFIGLDLNLLDGAVQVYSPQNDPQRSTGELTIPRDRWFCFRASLEVADEGEITSFVDDELALAVSPFDGLPEQGVHMLRAGVDWSSEQAAFFEVYIDDLVLDTAPVLCR